MLVMNSKGCNDVSLLAEPFKSMTISINSLRSRDVSHHSESDEMAPHHSEFVSTEHEQSHHVYDDIRDIVAWILINAIYR